MRRPSQEKRRKKNDRAGSIRLIGETAPAFEAETKAERIKFPDDSLRGGVGRLLPAPCGLRALCTTDFMTFAHMEAEFKAPSTELLGLSIDSTYSRIAWRMRSCRLQALAGRGKQRVEKTGRDYDCLARIPCPKKRPNG